MALSTDPLSGDMSCYNLIVKLLMSHRVGQKWPVRLPWVCGLFGYVSFVGLDHATLVLNKVNSIQ